MIAKKRWKICLVSLIVCLTLLLVVPLVTLASDGVKLTAGSVTGKKGEQVTVNISIASAEGTEGGQFDLIFDPAILDPDSSKRGAFVPDTDDNLFMSNLNLAAGKLRVMWVIPAGAEADSGVVASIVFDVLDSGKSSLTFDGVVISPEGVTIGTHVPGEVNVPDVDDKEAAIAAAIAAIAALPAVDDITLEDKPAVQNARALVNAAKALGAVDADITNLEKLVAAEKKITLLEAIKAANDAIAELPAVDDLTLADGTDVKAARALVVAAKELGAVDSDFVNLAKLVAAEEKIAKLAAIKAADDAILALPSVDSLKLDDKPLVVAARALVNKAKQDHGAVDSDFKYLSILVAAENRIKELEGVKPTPPTGALQYWLPAGILIFFAGIIAVFSRRKTYTGLQNNR